VLVVRDVDACNTGHGGFLPGNLRLYQFGQGLIKLNERFASSLPLLVARIAADHAHHPLAAHDLALAADFLH
jgi:hypothetical protein